MHANPRKTFAIVPVFNSSEAGPVAHPAEAMLPPGIHQSTAHFQIL